jgi:hypothetical protein
MPIPLGIFAVAGAGAAGGATYEQIATQVLGSDTSSITFSSIPSIYKHLQIRGVWRGTTTGAAVQLQQRVNGDTASNYAWHRIWGDSGAVTSGTGTSTNIMLASIGSDASVSAAYGAVITDILDYSSSVKNKTLRSSGGFYNPSVGQRMTFASGLWQNTAVISSLTLLLNTGSIAANSRFSLYGIRG